MRCVGRWSVVAGAVLAACVGNDPDAATPTSGGTVVPEAGADAMSDAGPTCAAPPRCTDDGAALVTCAGTEPCRFGCDPVPKACRSIAPSGAVATADLSLATANVTLDAADTYYVETETGIIGLRDGTAPKGTPIRTPGSGLVSGIGYSVVEQPGGPKIAVFSFGSLTVAKAATLRVVGPHAVALATKSDFVVDGTIDVRADCEKNAPGPGGRAFGDALAGQNGARANTNPGFYFGCGGGGGGGNGAKGGHGSSAYVTYPDTAAVIGSGGTGGAARGKTLLEDPLLIGGGAGGGGGSAGATMGGAGGGAIQLVAGGTLTISGLIDAAGCGGAKGFGGSAPMSTHECVGAGGGGAGGTILIEAFAFHVTDSGRVVAHGGGGGGGANALIPSPCTDGSPGTADTSHAKGGTADNRGGVCPSGGDGDPEGQVILDDCQGNARPAAASGGGGAIGVIATRTRDGAIVVDDKAVVQPTPTRGIAVVK